MSFKIKSQKKIDLNKVKLDIEITNNVLKKNIGRAYKDISNKTNIPGFRKGKIPYQVIDSNYGRQYVLNEAASLAISELYPEIIEQSGLNPIDYPKVKITQIKEDMPLWFEIELDLEPEIELPRYKGIKVTGISADVSDEELERQIDSIRGSFASLEPVSDNRPIEKGDYVTLDFDGKIDGKSFSNGSEQDYLLEVGSGTLFADFENSLIGMKKGESKKVTLKLPDNPDYKDAAGREADYNISIKEIKARKFPEFDEGFLKSLGDYKDEEDFRNSLRKKLVEQKENLRKEKIVGEIIDYLVNNINSGVPEAMLKRRARQINEEIDRNLKNQNINREEYVKAVKITEDKLDSDIRERAERETKEYLIFKALERVEKRNIEPSEEEINEEKNNILKIYEKEEDNKKVKEFLESDDGKENLVQTLRRRKIIDLLVSNAKVEEEKSTGGGGSKSIWKPGKNKTGDEASNEELWTPGSK